ncbi:DUF6894 family protein [Tropicibacter alexandrii]|uniref:DUF6894 family protein n=1 Tax=Tropicibacter alexandrii TaxID=2267683 RepID=UPI000EF468E5|nr:hypothetical protein [Tropicibacter alexandrii]
MTLFFFDINDGGHAIHDDTGTELLNRDEARKAALAVLAPIARDNLPDNLGRPVTVTVRDGTKRPIFRASLVFSEGWID